MGIEFKKECRFSKVELAPKNFGAQMPLNKTFGNYESDL